MHNFYKEACTYFFEQYILKDYYNYLKLDNAKISFNQSKKLGPSYMDGKFVISVIFDLGTSDNTKILYTKLNKDIWYSIRNKVFDDFDIKLNPETILTYKINREFFQAVFKIKEDLLISINNHIIKQKLNQLINQ